MYFQRLTLILLTANLYVTSVWSDFMTGLLLGFLLSNGHKPKLESHVSSALQSEISSILQTTTSTASPYETSESYCGPNATLTDCLNECGRTCPDFATPVHCTRDCARAAHECTCVDGFVRDTRTALCVAPNDCTERPYCPPNEVYYHCGSCAVTCDNRSPVCPPVCQSRGNCDCAQGFARHRRGHCVPAFLCSTLNHNRKMQILSLNSYGIPISDRKVMV